MHPWRAGPAPGAHWGASHPEPLDYAPTVAGLLHRAGDGRGDAPAVITPEGTLTYADVDRRSRALAASLVRLGVHKGSTVGILLPNGGPWVTAWAAATRIGAIAAPVNTFYKGPELATMLRHADVQVLIAVSTMPSHDFVRRLEEAVPGLAGSDGTEPLLIPEFPQLRHVVMWDGVDVAWATATGVGDRLDDPVPHPMAAVVAGMEDDVVPADVMLVTYTSGSTGEPKGVVHGHGPMIRHAANLARMSGMGPDDRVWTPMPLCWVGGFAFTLLRAFAVGGAFVTQDRMDAGVALELMERARVTVVSGWPALATTLESHPDFAGTDLSAVRLGALLSPRAHRPADPGLAVTSLGMSETGGPHTFWTEHEDLFGFPPERRGTFGHQLPGLQHRIVDEDGNDVDEGVEGEVWVRGYSLMHGLHRKERHEVFDVDGWYATGDRGYFDDGWFYFTGRSSDMIKTKGANVAPAEVERALLTVDGVSAAFVFGVDHDDAGQEVVALVVADTPAEAIVAAAADRLSSYKVPRHVFLVDADAVPFLSSQKPDRLRLADTAAKLTRQVRDASP